MNLASEDGGGEPWNPPIDIGEGGWRESEEPWEAPVPWECRFGRYFPLDIWSEPGAVYTLYGWEEFRVMDGGAEGLGGYVSFQQNDGTGWREWWRVDQCDMGAPDCVDTFGGRLSNGILVWSSLVGLASPEELTFPWPELSTGGNYFVVNENLAYGLWNGLIIRFNGSTWSPLPYDPPSSRFSHIWANETEVWLAGEDGAVAEWTGEDWRIHDAGTIATFGALWGMGDRRVWLAGGEKLFYYDGSAWEEIPWPDASADSPCTGSRSILGFWGSGESLFFHTQHQVVHWNGAEFRVLGYWPHPAPSCTVGGVELKAIWGNSAEEVFLAGIDTATLPPECPGGGMEPVGTPFILYWDGSSFHWI
jgi:hypothetical protein